MSHSNGLHEELLWLRECAGHIRRRASKKRDNRLAEEMSWIGSKSNEEMDLLAAAIKAAKGAINHIAQPSSKLWERLIRRIRQPFTPPIPSPPPLTLINKKVSHPIANQDLRRNGRVINPKEEIHRTGKAKTRLVERTQRS